MVVIGAGIAGLTAAVCLAERGVSVTVLEAQRVCGGRVQTDGTTAVTFGGQTWQFPDEHGIHGVWSQYHNFRSMLKRVRQEGALIPAQGQEWVHGNRTSLHRLEVGRILTRSALPAPFHYVPLVFQMGFLRLLRPWDVLRLPFALAGLIVAASMDPMRDIDLLKGKSLTLLLEGWPPPLRHLFSALARNGLSADPEAVGLGDFVAWLRFYTFLRRDAWGFHFFRADPGSTLIEPMLTALREAHGRVLVDCRAIRLQRVQADLWHVEYEALGVEDPRGDGVLLGTDAMGGETYQDAPLRRLTPVRGVRLARNVVLALDAPGSRSLLTGTGSSTEADARLMEWPTAQATVVVRFWFSVLPVITAEAGVLSGDFSADNFFWLQNFHDGAYLWHRATGGSAIELHVYGPPALLARDDADILRLTLGDVERLYPDVRGTCVQHMLRRNPPVHTLYRTGTGEGNLAVVAPWAGIVCCGDWIRHDTPSLFLERACITGIAAANVVLAERGLEPYVIQREQAPEGVAHWLERILYFVRRWT